MKTNSWRKIEKLVSRIITLPRRLAFRSWKGQTGKNYKQPYAWCDGLIIGSGPWLCYCCKKVRDFMKGKRVTYEKESTIYDLGRMPFLRIFTHRNCENPNSQISYIWPVIKIIYPTALIPMIDKQRRIWRNLDKERKTIYKALGIRQREEALTEVKA